MSTAPGLAFLGTDIGRDIQLNCGFGTANQNGNPLGRRGEEDSYGKRWTLYNFRRVMKMLMKKVASVSVAITSLAVQCSG